MSRGLFNTTHRFFSLIAMVVDVLREKDKEKRRKWEGALFLYGGGSGV
jgi:hypothetical protein